MGNRATVVVVDFGVIVVVVDYVNFVVVALLDVADHIIGSCATQKLVPGSDSVSHLKLMRDWI